jgi:hypothetical protein
VFIVQFDTSHFLPLPVFQLLCTLGYVTLTHTVAGPESSECPLFQKSDILHAFGQSRAKDPITGEAKGVLWCIGVVGIPSKIDIEAFLREISKSVMRSVFLTPSERVLHFSCGTGTVTTETDKRTDKRRRVSRIEWKCNSTTRKYFVLRTSKNLKVQNGRNT